MRVCGWIEMGKAEFFVNGKTEGCVQKIRTTYASLNDYNSAQDR
jgi:hypothetical protein